MLLILTVFQQFSDKDYTAADIKHVADLLSCGAPGK